MPLQHSPTKALEEDIPRSGTVNLQQSSSTPNLIEADNITLRPIKRKQGDDDFLFLMSKMESMFSSWQAKQDIKFDAVLTTISTQNEQIKSSLSHITQQYDQLKETVEQLMDNRRDELQYIKALEDKIEILEKKTRSTSVEIRNIPPRSNESSRELMSIAMKLGSVITAPIQSTEIKNIFRINKKDGSKPIILELTSDLLRNNLIDSFKKYCKSNGPNSPSTQDLGLEGPASKIYLSEFLTQKTQHLYFLARNYAKSNNYNYCWTAHGNVFLRKQQGDLAVRIRDETDLSKLANSKK